MTRAGSLLNFLSTHGMGRALRHRDYTLYAVFGWFSNIGLWVQRVAVQGLTWSMTASYAWLGAVAFAEGVVTVFVMPLAGTYADRVDRLWLAKLTQIGSMIVAGMLAALILTDQITLPLLIALMMLSGVVEGFWTPVRLGMAPNLVSREDLSAALGISATLFNVAQFVGPMVAALIFTAFVLPKDQYGYAIAFNSLTFLSYLIALSLIKLNDETLENRSKGGSFFEDFRQGLSYIAGTEGLRTYLFLMLMAALCMRPFRELFAGISEDIFNRGVDGLTILTTATGIGAVLGSLAVANFSKVHGAIKIMIIFLAFDVLLQIWFAFNQDFWIAVGLAAAMGFAITYPSINGQVLIQTAIRGEMRGRVMGLWGIVMRGGLPTGAMILGALSSLAGFQDALLMVTAVFIAVLLYVSARRQLLVRLLESPPK